MIPTITGNRHQGIILCRFRFEVKLVRKVRPRQILSQVGSSSGERRASDRMGVGPLLQNIGDQIAISQIDASSLNGKPEGH
jgi:hypothetical protein